MKNLRSIVLETYEKAEKKVVERIKKSGYLTFEEFDQCLQKQVDRFEKHYMKKHGVDSFSVGFVKIVFDEYKNHARSKLGLKALIPPQREAEWMCGGLLGSNEEILEKTYRRLNSQVSF